VPAPVDILDQADDAVGEKRDFCVLKKDSSTPLMSLMGKIGRKSKA
jgi:hypothetical protein